MFFRNMQGYRSGFHNLFFQIDDNDGAGRLSLLIRSRTVVGYNLFLKTEYWLNADISILDTSRKQKTEQSNISNSHTRSETSQSSYKLKCG